MLIQTHIIKTRPSVKSNSSYLNSKKKMSDTTIIYKFKPFLFVC